ncbi:MFS transporter [Gilvimarinus agarilyticus]|uniref:MFS transporter n=1 Tax=Gilvimarinus agarilyticus TaxID=679259 RepID=UPI00069737D0|nr:MFS transporter [Gilvimarinus agarilyticus]
MQKPTAGSANLAQPATHSQFQLLRERRFYPLFWTQFGGAFNDNFYKSALMMLFTYGGVERWGLSIDMLNNLVAAALIIPFFLFAPSAGQYADRLDKARVTRVIKLVELAVMVCAAVAIIRGSLAMLLAVIFATGIQSACFSPLKYAILPQHVNREELTGANALFHTGTSLAVFLGLIAGTLAMQWSSGQWLVAAGGILIAWAGWRFSRVIPPAPALPNAPPIEPNPLRQMARTMGYARQNKTVFWCLIGVSWYWFLGSVYLTQLPNFTREVLGGSAAAVTCLLVLFLLGVIAGALLCEKLSRHKIEPALVPLGALLVGVAGMALALAGGGFDAAPSEALLSIGQLAVMPGFWAVAAAVLALGSSAGLYTVPLQALMQANAKPEFRAQVIAANNVLNALFMVAAAVFAVLVLGVLDFTIPHFFMLTMALHCCIIILILVREPLFLLRLKTRFFSRVKTSQELGE